MEVASYPGWNFNQGVRLYWKKQTIKKFTNICRENGHGSSINTATSTGSHVIFPMEAEAYVQELTTFTISDIGSNKYAQWI